MDALGQRGAMELAGPIMTRTRTPMHRRLAIAFACWAVATGVAAAAPADCVEASPAAAERVIESCDALLADKATVEARVPQVLLARAQAFERQGRLKLAIDDLGRVLEVRPDHALAAFRRAELHRTLGEADAAVADFTRGLRLAPKNVAALFARAELYRAKADRRRALADYAAVLRLEPSHEQAAANHKALAFEIERLGAMMPVQQR